MSATIPTNTSDTKAKFTWIKGLDSIRFILAFIVLMSHYESPWVPYLKQSHFAIIRSFGMMLPNFFLGVGAVIAFFLISGLVIHYPNKDGINNVSNFLLRRWLRIGLPLIIVIAIAVPYNSFNLIPIWSLYCELIFYTIYPLLCKIKLSWKLKFMIAFFIALILICWLCRFDIITFIHQKKTARYGDYWQLGPSLTWAVGLPCWLLGVLIAEQLQNGSTTKSISFKKLVSLRTIVFVLSVILNFAKFHLFLSFVITMNFFALLLFVWLKNEILYYQHKKPYTFLEKLGTFSYSLYLLHALIFKMLCNIFTLTKFSYFVFIVLAVVIAYVFYLLVEKPSHLLAKKIAAKIL
ncbi:acyltransferase family protein [Ferruginibacter albus]|uniref:acyltransferase family protein n=1 Tax=Ferruginibacter albus TaxID=2875540 RepID=UPI001CC437E2|nr:acyltransferase family protein [Ferruginibacter albus]UAY50672.1 acyltransferase family protein [Ferruginibacter albus]